MSSRQRAAENGLQKLPEKAYLGASENNSFNLQVTGDALSYTHKPGINLNVMSSVSYTEYITFHVRQGNAAQPGLIVGSPSRSPGVPTARRGPAQA